MNTQAPAARTSRFAIEERGIEPIPTNERHGKPYSLATFWFATNVQITLVAIGAAAASLGLNLEWAIIGLLVGNLIGGLFMAYHSAQGPRMGIPQMVQSRAQFGSRGVWVPLIAVILMYLGYFTSTGVLGGQAIATLTHMPQAAGIVVCGVLSFAIAWVGHDLIHGYNRVMAFLSGAMFLAITIKIATMIPSSTTSGTVSAAGVILAISIGATGQITWAPYVSDYSRYLPESTPVYKTVLYTYLGSALGGAWMEILGAMVVIVATGKAFDNSPQYLSSLFPGFEWLFLIVIILGVFAANPENLYGQFLTLTTGISTTGKVVSNRKLRFIVTAVMAAIGTLFAIFATANLLGYLGDFLLIILYIMVPWTAINLTDYYIVRRGRYRVDEIFKLQGIYGRVNVWSVAIFVVTVGVEVPFMNPGFFTGPLAHALGGADIAWVVGLIFASVCYYLVAIWQKFPDAAGRRTVRNQLEGASSGISARLD